MSLPPPLNTRLAKAMLAARVGYAQPARMGEGALGRLFERRMQDEIAARLPPAALPHYRALRDEVRAAVARARTGRAQDAEAGFAAAEAHLTAVADMPATANQLRALGRSWIDQGYAYHALRQGKTEVARARLLSAMAADERLEEAHGLALIHIGRVHTAHLWLRLRAREGDLGGALDTANAILAYVNGAGASLPVGGGWDPARAEAVPEDLKAAMTCRIASECGALLAPLAPGDAAGALARLGALAVLEALDGPPDGGPRRAAAAEILAWRACKRAWCAGDSDTFLRFAVPVLQSGRRETALWYAVLLDLCRAAKALRPKATAAFVQEIAERTRADASPVEVLPAPLKKALAAAASGPSLFRHSPAKRQFHLICLGLPRSGTTSLYTLFARRRAGNEHAESATIGTLVARAEGRIDDAALDAALRRRDLESALEMDAASFMHLAADRLPEIFPQARFVVPVRDPAAWLDSYLRMLLRWHASFAARGRAPPDWMAAYGRVLFGRFVWDEIVTEEARARHLPSVAERFLTHWAAAVGRVLDLAPPPRRLVIRTEELSHSPADLAGFAGLPAAALTRDHHANAGPQGPSLVASLGPARLAEMRADLCGAVLDRLRKEAIPA